MERCKQWTTLTSKRNSFVLLWVGCGCCCCCNLSVSTPFQCERRGVDWHKEIMEWNVPMNNSHQLNSYFGCVSLSHKKNHFSYELRIILHCVRISSSGWVNLICDLCFGCGWYCVSQQIITSTLILHGEHPAQLPLKLTRDTFHMLADNSWLISNE